MCGYIRFMCDHDDGLALLVQLIYQRHDLLAGFTVQVAGGFICKQYRRVAHQCPCNSNTLALPARQLVGSGIEAITQANGTPAEDGKVSIVLDDTAFSALSGISNWSVRYSPTAMSCDR